jgi:hypothetical protein
MDTKIRLHVALVERLAGVGSRVDGYSPAQIACQLYTRIVGEVADDATPTLRAALWRMHNVVIGIVLARLKNF